MVDCHIHMVLDGVNWKEAIARHRAAPQEAFIRETLEQYQTLGFSDLRDGGDRWGVCDLAAKLAPEYGIRYRSPGFPIYKIGHYGGFIGRGFDEFVEYRALVREARTHGAHFIKIMISGLMDFERYGVLTSEPLPPKLIRDMIACAHDEGFSVMAHANGDEAVRAALEQQGACAVLLQLKSTFGNFYYSSSIDGAELADVDTAAVDSLIDWLSQHGYYLIAEVPAFCDTAFALANSAAALPLSSGALWMDSNGCYWLDPASETVMIYLKQIARELSSRGFREVVFSDFRFPASNSISYHSEKSGAELTQDAAQELTTFFSGSNLMISFETDDTAFPADVCTGRLYIRDVDGSKIEKFAQAYGSAENLTELVFLVNSKDTRFDERAVLRPLLNS